MAGAQPLNAAPMACSRLYDFLSERWWLAFLLLGFSFVMFGLASLNLLHLVSLIALGYFAALFYVLFKLCEKVLVERLTCGPSKGH